jgi:hypothetical protein
MTRVPVTLGPREGAQRPVFAVAEAVLDTSEKLLRRRGSPLRGHHERVVYWAGIKRSDLWMATTVVRPQAKTTWGSFRTSDKANADVVAFLSACGLALVAQVHTHPGQGVDHSDGDDADAFMPSENYLSIVVPDYGKQGMRPIERCGVHRFESGHFRRIVDDELRGLVAIVPSLQDFDDGRR